VDPGTPGWALAPIRATLPLPTLRDGLEPDVLREHDAAELVSMRMSLGVELGPATFDVGQHVHAGATFTSSNDLRNRQPHLRDLALTVASPLSGRPLNLAL
jgi:hypothetical protein